MLIQTTVSGEIVILPHWMREMPFIISNLKRYINLLLAASEAIVK
jgi:hypothetical protein